MKTTLFLLTLALTACQSMRSTPSGGDMSDSLALAERPATAPDGDSTRTPMTTPAEKNGINAPEAMTATLSNMEQPTAAKGAPLADRIEQQLRAIGQEENSAPTTARKQELTSMKQSLLLARQKLQEVENTLAWVEKQQDSHKK
ncbi:hypothetical protein [Siphonobacter aquaeclarae]|uniref:Uncharacterized protein n=1 Tax=Siphonobacter aquaeclarae TaxID=563176 RepID=A0A1G9VY07_9BACT|nr:hypothetical protein [Siphonobacter aquaeclarae]SDM77178.1 hypothetical protein SAMN04488090_4187 [Siphonobacter aquaeclarae]